MSHPSSDVRPLKNQAQVIDRVVDGEVLLIHLTTGDYYSLDEVGACIWQYADGTRSAAQIADLIAADYVVDREVAVTDVLRLVNELTNEGLLLAQ